MPDEIVAYSVLALTDVEFSSFITDDDDTV